MESLEVGPALMSFFSGLVGAGIVGIIGFLAKRQINRLVERIEEVDEKLEITDRKSVV